MKKETETLADYVRRNRREKGLSLKQVEQRSGRTITNGYVSRIENGVYVNPTSQKLRALARGLGVREEELFAITRGINENEQDFERSAFYQVYLDYTNAPQGDKEFAKEVLEMLGQRLRRRA